MSGSDEPTFGRRNYDVEIAELRLHILALQQENKELKDDIKSELREIRAENKELLEAWKSAKGLTAFVKWLAGLIIAGGVIVALIKGIKG